MDLRDWVFKGGAAVPSATVAVYEATLAHPNPGAPLATTTTDGNGMWSFTGLTASPKDVHVVAQGIELWYKGLGRLTVSGLYVADGAFAARELLTGARTYYVRTDGNDGNTGLVDSSGGAFLTWQKAVNVAAALDTNGQVVTLKHGAEVGIKTFTVGVTVPTIIGGGSLVIEGKDTSGSTFFNVTGGNAWTLNNTLISVAFKNCKLQASGETGVIQPTQQSTVSIQSGVIFGSCSSAHIWVHDRQSLAYLLNASYTIAGGGNAHIIVNGGMVFHESCTVTMSGTPAFTGAFIEAINGGAVQSPNSSTFTGATTGTRYTASGNGVIDTFGGGASYFPGNAAGSVTSGGQYL